jgi:hypothetical protein
MEDRRCHPSDQTLCTLHGSSLSRRPMASIIH